MKTTSRGHRMKIIPGSGSVSVASTASVGVTTKRDTSAEATTSSSGGPLQSAVLQPALAALKELPDIDHERVAALRDALAKGELPFDARKLAALIESYHRATAGGRDDK